MQRTPSSYPSSFATITCLSIALCAFAPACSEKLEGPKPSLEPPSAAAAPPPVDPEIVCRDQLTTEVAIHGERLSPVPIDIPKSPKTALPTITLARAHDLDGGAVSAPD